MPSTAHQSRETTDLSISPAVRTDLALVEERLSAELDSREPRLSTIARHLVAAGGKRVRPLVVLLVYHALAPAGHPRRDDAIAAAVALELIHSATLLHDDIIDGAETRRGQPSTLATFGVANTLVAGDFLFCRAFGLCARFEAEVIRWATDACVALTEGEIMQGRFRHDAAVTEADYDEIVLRKTACLFATGARTAAHLSGAAPAVVEAMASAGRDIGLAFQMRDDLLDVAGDPRTTGKPLGIDLRDGNPSLPTVLALPRSAELRRLFALPSLDGQQVAQALRCINDSGVVDEVAARARARLAAAMAVLGELPPSPERDALHVLGRDLGDRIA